MNDSTASTPSRFSPSGELPMIQSPTESNNQLSNIPQLTLPVRLSNSSLNKNKETVELNHNHGPTVKSPITSKFVPIKHRNYTETSPLQSFTSDSLPPAEPEYLKHVFLKFIESKDKRVIYFVFNINFIETTCERFSNAFKFHTR